MKEFKVKKIGRGKKALISVVLIFSFLFLSVPTHPAQAWIASEIAVLSGTYTKYLDFIIQTITALLKNITATMLNKIVNNLVSSGNNGGPMFITNWQDYLAGTPQKQTQSYMNDYLSQFTRGMGSSSGYKPAPGFEGVGQNAFNQGTGQYANYAARVVEMIKADVVSPATPRMTFNMNPAQVYDQGNFKQDSLLRSSVNTPMAARVAAWTASANKLQELQSQAQTKAIAGQGFLGKEQNGMTVTPGAVIKDTLSNTSNIGNDIVSGAKSIPEILAALATRLVTETISKGIGNISVQVQKQVTGVQNRNQTTVKAQVQTSGPGVLYKK